MQVMKIKHNPRDNLTVCFREPQGKPKESKNQLKELLDISNKLNIFYLNGK